MNNLEYEIKHYQNGSKYIAGVDEVGRGPLAGPVVAAAVIMPKDFYLEGITDSKKLSLKKRNEYEKIILENAISVSISFQSEKVIDEINIYEASRKAMICAINDLSIKPDIVLVDAMPLDIPIETESIIKGDEKSFSRNRIGAIKGAFLLEPRGQENRPLGSRLLRKIHLPYKYGR